MSVSEPRPPNVEIFLSLPILVTILAPPIVASRPPPPLLYAPTHIPTRILHPHLHHRAQVTRELEVRKFARAAKALLPGQC